MQSLTNSLRLVCLLLAAASGVGLAEESETRLLRFPAIQGDRVVFTYAGDLYTVGVGGGVARRLTTGDGFEMFAKFSPDGKFIAFTGQYDGNTEVFVMPSEGGVPRRLTHTPTLARDDVSDRMGPNNIVLGWVGDEKVLFRSRGWEWNDFKGQLFLADVNGAPLAQLPLPRGGWASYSPDGSQLAYNRVFREFRTWKRYRGGQADDIWIYNFNEKTTRNITNDPAQDVFPMWRGDRVYFLSDRDENRRFNLHVHDLTDGSTTRLTEFSEFDIKFPSISSDAIAFENGGHVYRFDLATHTLSKISIQIREDFASARGGLRDVSGEITSAEIAPDGSRALFGARGDVFTVPAKHGNTRNLTRSPGVHERNAKWSPDGKWIAYVSDASGEDEIYIAPQDGQGSPTRLTQGGDTYKFEIEWSPDSKKILWADKKQRLQYVEVEGHATKLVAQGIWELRDFSWSPDSAWIAFTMPQPRQFSIIQLYSVETGETIPVTDSWFASNGPVFTGDGKHLFFVSNRSFSPSYSGTEWNHAYFDMEKIYFVTLAKETPSPFKPKSDEVKLASGSKDEKKEEKKDEKKEAAAADDKQENPKEKEAKPVKVKVDREGLAGRIGVLPGPASGYGRLASVGDKLFYIRSGFKAGGGKLFVYELGKEKETELGEVRSYDISADGKKMLVAAGSSAYHIIDLPSAKLNLSDRLSLSDLKVDLDRKAEWRQIFQESWRQMRDFVYAPNMHGVDWEAERARYAPLLEHVNHRADLTYVIGEMISELNLGHSYVGGGDYPKAARVKLGLLGAKLERDPGSGYFKIVKILRGQNWDSSLRSPLTDIGVDASEQDFIIAVDGVDVAKVPDLGRLLVNTAGKQVTLKLNKQPKAEGARDVVVVPTDNEQPLYYLDWVLGNIDKVSKATGGRIGYVHIPNMGVDGLNEFVKFYYPQLNKEGLIVDVRGNGGGNVSPQIIERLRREPAMITVARNAAINVDPSGTMLGPKVMLLDEFSASDGDIVAYRFKRHNLGTVVGKRSWGGVVGIRGTLPLLDGGTLNRPEFSRYDLEGKEWIMEGVGVEPDVMVDNDPAREFEGVDDQLAKALELIQAELAKNPVRLPEPPPYPDKRR